VHNYRHKSRPHHSASSPTHTGQPVMHQRQQQLQKLIVVSSCYDCRRRVHMPTAKHVPTAALGTPEYYATGMGGFTCATAGPLRQYRAV
ncbi:hypothetical protein HaLaN_18427, partial [Haematococcus lacustris]